VGGRGLYLGIVAGARDWVTEGLIGLVDQLRPGFCLVVQSRCMIEAIRMPDLNLLMPGFFDLSVCCGRQEFEKRIIIGCSFFPHRTLLFKITKCSGAEERVPAVRIDQMESEQFCTLGYKQSIIHSYPRRALCPVTWCWWIRVGV